LLEALKIVISVSLLVIGILILVYILPKLIYGKKLIRFGYPDEKGNAPGWVARCPKCGFVVNTGDIGLIRIAAKGNIKNMVDVLDARPMCG
jgi:hypothetical protein